MRKVTIVVTALSVLLIALAGQAFAVKKTPKNSPKKTRVYRRQESHSLGWYVTPTVKIAEIQGLTRGLAGIRGGLILDRTLFIGIAGYGVTDPNNDFWDDWDDFHTPYEDHWDIGYGGLEVGLLSSYASDAQLSLGVLIGGGQIEEHFDYDRWYSEDGFFVLEPSADLLFHFSRHVALGVGAGYRFIDGVETPRFTDDDLDGPSFNISLQIGSF